MKKIFGQMRRWVTGGLILVLAACGRLGMAGGDQGALQVTSNAAFGVYLNDNYVGQTPFYDEKIGVGEYVLKLVPNGAEGSGVWQTPVMVDNRALSVVHYEHGRRSELSTSEVMELEKLPNEEGVELSLTSIPDNVVVRLDEQAVGFSPVLLDDLTEGDHVLAMEAVGYKTKTINLKLNRGYRLNVAVQLARDEETMIEKVEPVTEATGSGELLEVDELLSPSPSPSPSIQPETSPSSGFGQVIGGVITGAGNNELTKPYVEIRETGTGWLRVRSQAVVADNEVAKVKTGTFFPLAVVSNNQEWVKIEYQKDKEGWVSKSFVRIVE